MSLSSAALNRAESLSKIRDLVALGIEQKIVEPNKLFEAATARNILVTIKGNQYSRSSKWRFIDSLNYLGFNLSKNSDFIVWSQAASSMHNASSETQFTDNLSENEKEIFRQQIFESAVRQRFLSLFCPSFMPPRSRDSFANNCKPLYILRFIKKSVNSTLHYEDTIEFTQNPDSYDLNDIKHQAAQDFQYWWRLWCLDAEIIDEINVEEAARNDIPQKRSNVLYPIRHGKTPSVSNFLDLLYASVGNSRFPAVMPIVKILYELCLDLRISVKSFKELLLETWKEYRHLIHLERGPGILIQGSTKSKKYLHSNRYRNHRYYIIVDGTIRTNLVLMPRV